MFGMVVQQLLVPYRTNVKGASEFTTKDCGNPVRYQAIVVKVAFRVDPWVFRVKDINIINYKVWGVRYLQG
jgi:hypothetical protein